MKITPIDRLRKAIRTGDSSAALSELEKITNMLGETKINGMAQDDDGSTENVMSEQDKVGEAGTGGLNLTINVNGSTVSAKPGAQEINEGYKAPGEDDDGVGIPDDDDDDDNIDDYEFGEGGDDTGEDRESDVAIALHAIMDRLERLEKAIITLAGGQIDEGSDDADGDDDVSDQEEDVGGDIDDDGGDDGGDDGDNVNGANAESPMNEQGSPEGDQPDEEDKRDRPSMSGDRRRPTKDAAPGKRAMIGDSTSMRTVFADTVSRAELLVPGITLPTFDAKRPATATNDALCTFRRSVLRRAMENTDKREAILPLLAGKKPAFADKTTFSCDTIVTIFNAASEVVRQKNNFAGGTHHARGLTRGSDVGGQAATPASINERNAKLWANK